VRSSRLGRPGDAPKALKGGFFLHTRKENRDKLKMAIRMLSRDTEAARPCLMSQMRKPLSWVRRNPL
jgi:hypothetical protein